MCEKSAETCGRRSVKRILFSERRNYRRQAYAHQVNFTSFLAFLLNENFYNFYGLIVP